MLFFFGMLISLSVQPVLVKIFSPATENCPFESTEGGRFVCVEVLRPINPMGTCQAWSVYLNIFTGHA